jgi:6-phosphogluconolactonase
MLMALFSFSTPDELADAVCEIFRNHIAGLNRHREQINLAFSGGTTPELFFRKLAANQENPDKRTDWKRIHIFWVDERCVPPGHRDSNYGMTQDSLLSSLNMDKDQIHRIHGEEDPLKSALRYENEIRDVFQKPTGIPVFDWIFLGMGEDGHTASIFPDRPDLLKSPRLCEVSRHPVSGQSRITLTAKVITNSRRISFLVTGDSKSRVIRQILLREPGADRYPAFHIVPENGDLDWYLDTSAANQLNLKK